MKRLSLIISFCTLLLSTKAQQPDFEGSVVYQTQIESRLPDISAEGWKQYLHLSDSITMYYKKGFYKELSPAMDVYYQPDSQKVYRRFEGIDSLFYAPYQYDTSAKMLDRQLYNAVSSIGNRKCNKLDIETNRYTISYEYDPTLHVNPKYDAGNTGDCYDVYMQAAQSLYLRLTRQSIAYTYTRTANRISPSVLPDSIFKLPPLPITPYSYSSVYQMPEFKGGLDGYRRYLEKHLDHKLAARYVEIPRGQKEGLAVVKLMFVLTAEGKIADVQAINRRDVHPFLADDAEKVMRKVPDWKPATLMGKKIPFIFIQSVTYQAVL